MSSLQESREHSIVIQVLLKITKAKVFHVKSEISLDSKRIAFIFFATKKRRIKKRMKRTKNLSHPLKD